MNTEMEAQPPHESAGVSALSEALHDGLRMVADLERSLWSLDTLLLTGRPHAIADAARAMELCVSAAEPVFQRIVLALETRGMARLGDAARHLRQSDRATAAAAADSLRMALKHFTKRNDACRRRAQGFARSLGASLRTLHALGLAGNGRLIAEA